MPGSSENFSEATRFNSSPLLVAAANYSQYSTSEYIEIVYLIGCLLIGGPVNLVAFTRLNDMRKLHCQQKLLLFKLHLNISDLMIICVCVTGKLCWFMTFEWRGGSLLCPVFKYAQVLSLHLSSNVVVAIAIDRFLSVFSATYNSPKWQRRGTYLLLSLAWICAIVSSLPQFWTWKLYRVYMPSLRKHLAQCATVWIIGRFEHTLTGAMLSERAYYNMCHVLIMFWIPATIILICYCSICAWMCTNTKRKTPQTRRHPLPCVAFKTLNPHACTTLQQSGESEFTVSNIESSDPLTKPSGSILRNHMDATPILLKKTVAIVAAYIILWAPYNTLCLWMVADSASFGKHESKLSFLYAFVLYNSVVNPFLYNAVALPSIATRKKPV